MSLLFSVPLPTAFTVASALVLGLVVLVTFVAVLLNLLVDLAYALLDPKIRY